MVMVWFAIVGLGAAASVWFLFYALSNSCGKRAGQRAGHIERKTAETPLEACETQGRAERIVRLLSSGHHEEVAAEFTPELRSQFTASRLKVEWESRRLRPGVLHVCADDHRAAAATLASERGYTLLTIRFREDRFLDRFVLEDLPAPGRTVTHTPSPCPARPVP